MSYLTAHQCRQILRHSHYTQPMTESWTDYLFYRGRLHASVLTLRFNWAASPTPASLETMLMDTLYTYFTPTETVTVIVDYDLLLRHSTVPDSFYLWRANSNRHHFDSGVEFELRLDPASLRTLTTTLLSDPRPVLDQNFLSSHALVDRILTVVVSFMRLHA